MHSDQTIRRQKKQICAWFRIHGSIAGFALVFLSSIATAFGQTEAVKPRPKIGLALASGGALGLAHIGVLDWFDKHHIPIDYIAGTSMGGLLAGGFAIGMTPDELRSTLHSIDWNSAFSGGPPYRDLPFRRKEDIHDLQSRLVVGLRKGIELPSGVTPANPINLLLSRISLPYSALKSFDDLPTPFRCMAVDMKSGQAVSLKNGSLATALRATMAIPGFFTPVERDGTLYTDGGTLNSIPTEALKAMGADIIVAVDLSSFFLAEKKPKSLVEVLGRSVDIVTYTNERRSLKLADIILNPDLGALDSADFTLVDAYAARGYQAAEAKKNILDRLALNDADWKAYVAARNARKRVAVPTAAFVEVAGVSGKQAQELTRQLRRFVNAPLNMSKLEQTLTTITGFGRFESFFYDETQRGGQTGLRILPAEPSIGSPSLRFGLQVNGADTDNIRTDIATRLTALNVGGPGAEIRADLTIGSDRDLGFEYYRPVMNGRPFIAPRLFLSDDNVGLFTGGAHVATYNASTAGAGLDIGYNPGRNSQLRFGYQFEHQNASVSTGSPVLPSLRGDAGALRLTWLFDGQDSPTIPGNGIRLGASSYWYFYAPDAPRPFPIAQVNLSSFRPVGKGDSVFGLFGAGTTFGNVAGPLEQFTLGGPQSLAAYGPDEFRGNNALHMTLGYLHRVAQLPSFVGGKVMFGGFYQVGGVFQHLGSGRYLNDISVAFLADTLIGPVAVGYAYGESGQSRVYFAIGGLF